MEGLGLVEDIPLSMIQHKLPPDLIIELERLSAIAKKTISRHEALINHYVDRMSAHLLSLPVTSPNTPKLRALILDIRQLCSMV